MRPLLVLLAAALLGTSAVACGGAAKVARSTRPTGAAVGPPSGVTARGSARVARASGFLRKDGDDDNDDERPRAEGGVNDDQSLLASYDHRASPADARAVSTLVRRYYAVSVAGNGADACALLAADLARGLATEQGRAAQGPGGSCAAAISPLLAQQHQHLAAEGPSTMTLIALYAKGDLGLAVLGFRSAPESTIGVAREGRAWRIDALFDSLVP